MGDIVAFARSRHILCQGRGSAANSVVCYCLGITEVDPARMSVLFERFISKERNEPPDIDVGNEVLHLRIRMAEKIQQRTRPRGPDAGVILARRQRRRPWLIRGSADRREPGERLRAPAAVTPPLCG